MVDNTDKFSSLVVPSVQFLTIDEERAGQRVDNFLLAILKGVPKSMVYRIVRKGEVRVNKGRVKPTQRLKVGDVVRIPPVRVSEKRAQSPGPGLLECLEKSVIYEDEGLLIINKPSGVAVHGGSGINYGVIEAMRVLRPKQKSIELVHRLDRDTSGCLILAKKRSALRRMHEMLREGRVDKRYLALCRGVWAGGARIIDAPLKKNTLCSGERIVQVSSDGKEARSRFIPQTRFQETTLMEVKLFTGRTHQIRVHAAHSHHPIAGDDKYGDKAFNREMKAFGLSRLFLHAHKLRFAWSDQNKPLEVEAPLGSMLVQTLERLRVINPATI